MQADNTCLNKILTSLDDLIVVIDKAGKIDCCFNDHNGFPFIVQKKLLPGKSLEKVFIKKLFDRLQSTFEEMQQKKTNRTFCMAFDNAKEKAWFEFKINPLTKNSDQNDGYIIIAKDISRYKKAEDNYRRIFENAVMGIYQSTTGKGLHLSVNPALAKIYGYNSVEDLLNNITDISQQLFVDPGQREELLRRIEAEDEITNFESRVYKKDGSIIWISENAGAVRDENGKMQYIVGTVKDISEEKKLKQESEYRLQQIIQADKLKSLGEMVAGVAHEINNPNSYIVYNTSLLEKSWKVLAPLLQEYTKRMEISASDANYYTGLQSEMDEIIQSLKTGSKRIKNVVANLKDFAGMEENGAKYPVNMNEIIEKAFNIIQSNVNKKFKTINLALDGNIPKINANFQRLEQVIINLVINSMQSIPKNRSGILEVNSEFSEQLNCVILKVADDGIGISEVVMHKIFEPFFTTRRKDGGTGLGLSVSYEIIKEHNGKIGVMSAENVGTQFFIFLPLKEKESEEISNKFFMENKSDLFIENEKLNILLI